jgi:sigma-E factor negative regulatory protein RseB
MRGTPRLHHTIITLLAGTALAVAALARETTPDEWLQKMGQAVLTLDYEGTVIRSQDDDVQPLKIVHKKIDGVINERIVVQEGNGLEVIRVGDAVHCILPDKKSVLVEQWENASTLISTVPSSTVDPGAQYDVLILSRGGRIAGRSAVQLAIRPNDALRFEHRYWLDESTGFPLRTELVNHNGDVVDQLKFADIKLGSNISSKDLAPSINLANFTWYTNPSTELRPDIDSDWVSGNLPAGFALQSTRHEQLTGSVEPVTHLVYSDGLARVSVFIAQTRNPQIKRVDRRGASSSFSIEIDGFTVTAVGEVPPETLRMIASSMHQPR